ncbi:PorT family protein [Bacteroides salyersiae]|uniref:porin family protein n=1 Tax=Bacteroides salyersiae TaxID=291644 RepID=UPI001C392F49|nr:porin family protein [Bacteroides salyersiae]MBV4202603.1 PorT family protein [Bacteroides salyersiae]MCB6648154.1 PorT family protein [Bacteroides salyersiae]
MKKIILLVALTSLSFIIKAQTCFGVHTGLNYSTFSEIKELTDNSPYLCGLHLGVFMNYRINNIIDFQPEINYAQKGYKWSIDYTTFPNDISKKIRINFKYNFIEIPALFKFFIGQNFNISIGPQLDLCLNRKIAVKEGEEVVNEGQNGKGYYPGYHRVSLSLTGGIGYDFKNGIMLSARYSNGLTSIDKDNMSSRTSRNFLFAIGYKIFKLPSKK